MSLSISSGSVGATSPQIGVEFAYTLLCLTEGLHMKPRITLITLGVDDLETAVRFYRDGLGLKTDGIVGTEFAYGAVAFFDLQAGLKLALWPRTSMAHETGLPLASPSPTAFTLG